VQKDVHRERAGPAARDGLRLPAHSRMGAEVQADDPASSARPVVRRRSLLVGFADAADHPERLHLEGGHEPDLASLGPRGAGRRGEIGVG
jgi:hypothetical protein